MIPLSVLDVVPVRRGSTPGAAIRESNELAKHVEALGFTRYWFAEHHGMEGIGSSSLNSLAPSKRRFPAASTWALAGLQGADGKTLRRSPGALGHEPPMELLREVYLV